MFKLGFIQPIIKFGDFNGNVRRILHLIKRLKEWDLIVLPELVFTGYVFQSRKEVSSIGKKFMRLSIKWLRKLTIEYGGGVVAGYLEYVDADHIYNSAVLVVDGEVKGNYRKIHLFYKEKELFNAGDKEPEVYCVGKANVGIMICYDWMFPEVARVLGLKGADIIVHPSNLVFDRAYIVMRSRAIENNVYTLTVNRLGRDDRGGMDMSFRGGSQIVSPKMKLLYKSGEDEDAAVMDIDLSVARNKKHTELNDIFEDRRVELYKRLCI